MRVPLLLPSITVKMRSKKFTHENQKRLRYIPHSGSFDGQTMNACSVASYPRCALLLWWYFSLFSYNITTKNTERFVYCKNLRCNWILRHVSYKALNEVVASGGVNIFIRITQKKCVGGHGASRFSTKKVRTISPWRHKFPGLREQTGNPPRARWDYQRWYRCGSPHDPYADGDE